MNDDELVEHAVGTWAPTRLQEEKVKTSDAAVSVNGVVISARAINIESANYEGGSIPERQHQAAVALVIRELLLQRAAELELEPGDSEVGSESDRHGSDASGCDAHGFEAQGSRTHGPDVHEWDDDAIVDQLIEQELTVPEPDESACRRYFDNHRETFRSPDLFEVSHILIAADPRDEERRAIAKEQARAVISQLQSDPERFKDLAAELSDCPSKHTGGNLGQIGKGQTVPEFEDVLFRMQAGETSRSPVESRYGFHVIHVQRRIDGEPLDFDLVRERIADFLGETVRQQAIGQYLRILVGQAEISGIELTGSDGSLVQ